jgi:hypothetical protein
MTIINISVYGLERSADFYFLKFLMCLCSYERPLFLGSLKVEISYFLISS